ncbi:MAG: hypothetical protein F9K49_08720 [Caedimonadaceae bacterium]|nr:MAG: hypothetical protein F9K49_08720 [Caedimonadaceae bacterium]
MNYYFLAKFFLVGILYTCLSSSVFATTPVHGAAEDILYGTDDLTHQAIIRIINCVEDKETRLPRKNFKASNDRNYEKSNKIITKSRKSLSQKIEKLSPNFENLKLRVKTLIEFDPSLVNLSIFSYLLQEVDAEIGPID